MGIRKYPGLRETAVIRAQIEKRIYPKVRMESSGVSPKTNTRGVVEMIIRQYDLENSLVLFLERELKIRTDLVYDGYEFPEDRPFITIETMQNNIEILTKRREAVQRIYRYQVGLHADNPVNLRHTQEDISDLLTFKKIPYFSTRESADV